MRTSDWKWAPPDTCATAGMTIEFAGGALFPPLLTGVTSVTDTGTVEGPVPIACFPAAVVYVTVIVALVAPTGRPAGSARRVTVAPFAGSGPLDGITVSQV